MGIAPRQIGWSNESNLLWQISKQLEKLNGVVAATAAGGMLNPTTNYIPFNSGLAFGDSYLVNDTTASVLKTVYSASDIGLKLDFANNYYFLGDWSGNIQGNLTLQFLPTTATIQEVYSGITNFAINNDGTQTSGVSLTINNNTTNNDIKTSYQGNDIGLSLDFQTQSYKLGDANTFVESYGGFAVQIKASNITVYETDGQISRLGDTDGLLNNMFLEIDVSSQKLFTTIGGSEKGITIDFNQNITILGDVSSALNGCTLNVDDGAEKIFTKKYGGDKGLNLDFVNNVYWIGDIVNGNMGFICEVGESKIGDYNGGGNGTVLGVSDSTEQIIASSNLSAPSAGSSSGQFLKIKVGGVDYKIALLNNA